MAATTVERTFSATESDSPAPEPRDDSGRDDSGCDDGGRDDSGCDDGGRDDSVRQDRDGR